MNAEGVIRLSAGLVVLGLCTAVLLTQGRVLSDLSVFLPRQGVSPEHRVLTELREGPAARLVLIGIQSHDPTYAASLSKQLVPGLRSSPLFNRVLNGQDLLQAKERDWLMRYRYLLSPVSGAEDFTEARLREHLEQRLRELSSPLAVLAKPLLAEDPTGALRAVLASWQVPNPPPKRFGVWFDPDQQRALLMAETKAPAFDLDAQERVLDSLRAAFTDALETLPEEHPAELQVSGPAVFAVLSRDRMRSEAQLLSLIASVAVIVVMALAYRSARLVVLGAVPLACAVLAAVTAVTLVFGGIHAITLAFGITLLGVALDYPVHLFSHLQDGSDAESTVIALWPTLRLGVLTTVVAYLAMVTTGFGGLAQLGLFATTGLIVAAAVTRWGLPPMIGTQWRPRLDPADWRGARLSTEWNRVSRGIVLTGVVVVVVVGSVSAPPAWETDIAAVSPIARPALQLDRELRDALGAPEINDLLLIRQPDAESALQDCEQVAAGLPALIGEGTIKGFDAPCRYLPSRRTQLERQAGLPDAGRLRPMLEQAIDGLPFKPGLFTPFLEHMERSRELSPLEPDQLGESILASRVAATLFPHEGGWVALVPLSGLSDPGRLHSWLEAQPGLDNVVYLNIKAEMNGLVAAYRDAALWRLAWGGGVIVALLWLILGARRGLGRVLAPVGLALALVTVALSMVGQSLSLFHIIALLLVLGIGLDYSLFFSRPDPERRTRSRTAHAVTVCMISTVVVFGILGTSQIPVLRAIGVTVALGVAFSFLLSLALSRAPDPAVG